MSHSLAGEPPAAGRRAAPSTTAVYSATEWELLTGLPGRVVVVATAPAPGRPVRGVAAGLAGLEAVAAGRAFDSDLVRAVVAAIYARHDESTGPDRSGRGRRRRGTVPTDPVDLLTDCRTAARVLRRRADPADSAAYRQWVQSVAARVCREAPGGPALSPTDQRFLDRLGMTLGLR
ncbi:hypothetical protein GA0074692_4393 [Micromonospora pallida]|uniref:Uncharacterized protein n=1 Tax=Micromonospora pallida TaxID=145854 RepID=A0A1C6T4H9_9ACTN|nr:hypothetical protein [Micromonospora pallida]SCL36597.1 hypothetical protein GA0074692_4393 [Micromonospora pallida]